MIVEIDMNSGKSMSGHNQDTCLPGILFRELMVCFSGHLSHASLTELEENL